MKNIKKRPVILLSLCGIIFVLSITLLFVREKKRLDREYEGMIIEALNIHTHHNTVEIERNIANAVRAMQTAKTILQLVENKNPKDVLEDRNAANPVYIIEYTSLEDLKEGGLSPFVNSNEEEVLLGLMQGETAMDIYYNEILEAYFLTIMMPMEENGSIKGILDTRLNAEEMLKGHGESAVYQDAINIIVKSNGDLIFNALSEKPQGNRNLFDSLVSHNLTQKEIDQIAGIMSTPDIDSSIFKRHGENYFVSAAKIQYNDWYLVSFVRGPDVLMRSASIFLDMVRISIIAIFITIIIACVLFLLFLFNKRRLKEEQIQNKELTQRLQAMFNQHSALKVLINPKNKEIVDVNPAVCHYFDSSKEELIGRNIGEFNMLPTHVLEKEFENAPNDRAVFLAAPHRLKNGEIKFLDVYASLIRDEGSEMIYSILFDSTDREEFKDALFREKELLRITLQSIGDGVVTTDNQGLITSLNKVAEELTGWNDKRAIGKSFTEVFTLQNEDTKEQIENPIQKVLDTGQVRGLVNHTELINQEGKPISIANSAAPIKSENGQIFGAVMVFRDVSEEKEHSRKIEYLSYHDPLTGLYNRRYLEEMLLQFNKAEYMPVSVIIADVNGLKITNDVFGHKAGDILLKSAAKLMGRHCRKDDLVARWGGDEFVILMPKTVLAEAEKMVHRIKNTHINIDDSNLVLSLSLGCASKDTVDGELAAIMQQAEEYMYHQKLLEGKSYRNAIISTLLATLYEKSNETEEHSKRLEKYCHAIGRELRLSSNEMDDLSLLALLHDIGKVSIDPNILKKPSALTTEEWEEMKHHSEVGYRIAQATPELTIISDLILSHHERWDGRGYPHGLKREEIPLACRILAVVDAFDAMTNDRCYRQAMSKEESVTEIKKNAGTQFDPKIADLFIFIITKEGKKEQKIEFYEDTWYDRI